MSEDVIFETERLEARVWDLSLAEAALEMYGDPEVVRYIGLSPLASIDEMRSHLQRIITRNTTLAPPGQGSWPLFEKSTGTLVGTALLKPLPLSGTGLSPSDDIEIGWHLARSQWGRGFASEAGSALIRYGFEQLKLDVLHVVVESPNLRSLAVARRIGARHTGRTNRYYDLELEHFEIRRAERPA